MITASARLAFMVMLAATMYPVAGVADVRQSFGFALDLARHNVALRIDNARVDTAFEHVGITLWEPAAPELQLGLTLGQLWLTRADYPTAEGSDLNGFFLDLSATRYLGSFGIIEPYVHGNYGYLQATGADNGSAELNLHELGVDLGVRLALTAHIAVSAAIGGNILLGTEKPATPDTGNRDIEAEDAFGARLGLELNVDHGGYIGLRGDAGTHRGFTLYFARFY